LSRKEFDGLSLDEKLAYLDLDLLSAIYGPQQADDRPGPVRRIQPRRAIAQIGPAPARSGLGGQAQTWSSDQDDVHPVRPVRAEDDRLLDVRGARGPGDEIYSARAAVRARRARDPTRLP
jgi:hypothetical protein